MMTGSTMYCWLFIQLDAAAFLWCQKGGTKISAFDYYANLIVSLGDNAVRFSLFYSSHGSEDLSRPHRNPIGTQSALNK